jgi:hypothetical protein
VSVSFVNVDGSDELPTRPAEPLSNYVASLGFDIRQMPTVRVGGAFPIRFYQRSQFSPRLRCLDGLRLQSFGCSAREPCMYPVRIDVEMMRRSFG